MGNLEDGLADAGKTGASVEVRSLPYLALPTLLQTVIRMSGETHSNMDLDHLATQLRTFQQLTRLIGRVLGLEKEMKCCLLNILRAVLSPSQLWVGVWNWMDSLTTDIEESCLKTTTRLA